MRALAVSCRVPACKRLVVVLEPASVVGVCDRRVAVSHCHCVGHCAFSVSVAVESNFVCDASPLDINCRVLVNRFCGERKLGLKRIVFIPPSNFVPRFRCRAVCWLRHLAAFCHLNVGNRCSLVGVKSHCVHLENDVAVGPGRLCSNRVAAICFDSHALFRNIGVGFVFDVDFDFFISCREILRKNNCEFSIGVNCHLRVCNNCFSRFSSRNVCDSSFVVLVALRLDDLACSFFSRRGCVADERRVAILASGLFSKLGAFVVLESDFLSWQVVALRVSHVDNHFLELIREAFRQLDRYVSFSVDCDNCVFDHCRAVSVFVIICDSCYDCCAVAWVSHLVGCTLCSGFPRIAREICLAFVGFIFTRFNWAARRFLAVDLVFHSDWNARHRRQRAVLRLLADSHFDVLLVSRGVLWHLNCYVAVGVDCDFCPVQRCHLTSRWVFIFNLRDKLFAVCWVGDCRFTLVGCSVGIAWEERFAFRGVSRLWSANS